MKILFLTRSLETGGSERQLYYLISSLVKDKTYEVRLISITGGHYEEEYRRLGVTPIILATKDHQISLLRQLQPFFLLPRLIRHIQHSKPDIIHSFLFHTNIMAKLSLFFIKKDFKLICSYRSPLHHYFGLPLLERINMHRIDMAISNSKTADADLDRYHLPKAKRKIIPNAYELPKINHKRVREIKTQYAGKKLVITVGKLRPEKDYITNIKVAKLVCAQLPTAHFLYVGDGPQEQQLKRIVKKEGLEERISFLGKRTDIPELLAASDVFFLPTKFESQSNAIIEAMAAGLPIVTTDIPANRELLPAKGLCKVGDVEEMCREIERLKRTDSPTKTDSTWNFSKAEIVRAYMQVYVI